MGLGLELSCAGLCGNLYGCTCADHSIMCKHVHKVQSLYIRQLDGHNVKEEDGGM
jgi:uncharacterized Zn finger protein